MRVGVWVTLTVSVPASDSKGRQTVHAKSNKVSSRVLDGANIVLGQHMDKAS